MTARPHFAEGWHGLDTAADAARKRTPPSGSAMAIRQKEFGIWNPLYVAGLLLAARVPYRPRLSCAWSEPRAATGGHPVRESHRMGAGADSAPTSWSGGRGGGRCLSDQPVRTKSPTCWRIRTSEIIVCEDQEQVDKVLAASRTELPKLRQHRGDRNQGHAGIIAPQDRA